MGKHPNITPTSISMRKSRCCLNIWVFCMSVTMLQHLKSQDFGYQRHFPNEVLNCCSWSVSICFTMSQTLGVQNALRLRIHPPTTSESRGWKQTRMYDSLVPSIDVGVRNDQILKVTAIKFKLKGLFWGWQ